MKLRLRPLRTKHCPISAGLSGAQRRTLAELRPRSLKVVPRLADDGISEGI